MTSVQRNMKHLVLSIQMPAAAARTAAHQARKHASGLASSGLCSCFGRNTKEPPEITYQVVDANGGCPGVGAGGGGTPGPGGLGVVTLPPSSLLVGGLGGYQLPPMPTDEAELNAKFAEIVDELDLTESKKAVMFSLPAEKKWQLYISRKMEQMQHAVVGHHQPDLYLEKIAAFIKLPYAEDDEEEIRQRANLFESLKTALRTQTNSFVTRFLDEQGLLRLLDFLSAMDRQTFESSVHTSAIGCVKALMNNSTGRSHVLAHPTAINIIAQSLATWNVKTKIAVLEILGAVCLVPGGHKKVLEAMCHLQKFACERTRFLTIINDLDRSIGPYREDVNLKTAIMSFINAVLNYGPGSEHLEFRLHLRFELLMLGIQPTIDKLRKYENALLDRHLDIFEMVRNEDERELSKRYNCDHVDSTKPQEMLSCLEQKMVFSPALPHFLSFMQHLLLMPSKGKSVEHWILFDRLVQQIILQDTCDGIDHDVAVIQINVGEIIKHLASEKELRLAQEKAERFEKENIDLATSIAGKEQQLEQTTQERDDIKDSLEKTKDKLERETVSHLNTKQRIQELEYNIQQLTVALQQKTVAAAQAAAAAAAQAVAAAAGNENGSSMPPPPPPPPPGGTIVVPGGIPPPPPPPMGGLPGAPPPPPPPMGGLGAPPPPPIGLFGLPKKIVKNVPQPSNPLKTFNWSKLPESRLQGTIWSEVNEEKLYKEIDLDDVDKTFAAFKKNLIASNEDVTDVPMKGGLTSNKVKELSVIDPRRAQNCQILLTRLKLSNDEIVSCLLSMDSKEQLQKDMIEQMLKFVPTLEERTSLEEHSHQLELLAKADRFLYDVGKIVHYEQRLKTLCYKKTFKEKLNDIKPKITAVTEASKDLQRSRRLRRLLELVLAFGNYMNRGDRGNACGFKIASLNKLADTKSSSNRNYTLLHYVIETCQRRFREVLKIDEEISKVRAGSKVNLSELSKEMAGLKSGLADVQKEIDFLRGQAEQILDDKFVPVMRNFVANATYKYQELEELFIEMKLKYEEVVRLFGEDPSSVQPDEFFSIFDAFLTSFNDAKNEIDSIQKRRKEEMERQKELETKRKEKANKEKERQSPDGSGFAGLRKDSKSGSAPNGNQQQHGEFDDLISALRTGDVFGDEFSSKYRRCKKRSTSIETERERVR
ncbi:disheveled-associated activator of morphogenesis 1-like isoform X2 [Varroa jacobsoni]|uniref:Disheveled-associated activator of morphogenesis 1 n=1 Tax=Varroa destructor TaxID=109461 RepID=A0A7M7J0R2_VARDE|nr:disheveled-associated activator of morphogenesis 1-like isoform X2 [Varroa destructor]XP_022645281.1 disheveled-associated activator of morphogenesis 1-like isoform X2 [Varroa destructor]XP_022692783.1 disheveled-associated activator of morphogenesis 1-like isoform X2 [Varroa jacobsoni]